MAKKTALYHQAGKEPLLLEVAKSNPDGTVDLSNGSSTVVSGCVVSDVPSIGCATIVKAPSKPKSENAVAKKALEDAENAVKTAQAAFDADPTNADLSAALSNAQDALDALLED